VEWGVREGVGAGGEMNQALYAHMNNKRKMKKKNKTVLFIPPRDEMKRNYFFNSKVGLD
jgi:hypothetical protein